MTARGQTGMALVICLILLTVLTLLATSTMSTAALQLTMSGNDQYSARAFEAAEAGVESAIAAIAASPPPTVTTLAGTIDGGDTYIAVITPRGTFPPQPGYQPTFTAAHFEIVSTGNSLRDATVTHVQGLFIVQPAAVPTPAQTAPPRCMPGVEIRLNHCVAAGTAIRTYWRTAK